MSWHRHRSVMLCVKFLFWLLRQTCILHILPCVSCLKTKNGNCPHEKCWQVFLFTTSCRMKPSCVCFPSYEQTAPSYRLMQIIYPWRWLITFSTALSHVPSQSGFSSYCSEFRILPFSLWLLWVWSPAVMFPLAMLTRAHIGMWLLHSPLICQSNLTCSRSSLDRLNNQERAALDRTFILTKMGSPRQTSHSVSTGESCTDGLTDSLTDWLIV